MARVEKINKRKAAIAAMVEAIISGKSSSAETHLHDYLQTLSKELVLGEMSMDMDDDMDDEEMDPDEEMDMDDDGEDMDDDGEMVARSQKKCRRGDDMDDDMDDDMGDDDMRDDDIREGLKQPVEGAMKRKVVPNTKRGGKSGLEKHGNSSKHLDDKIKGKAKYARYPGKGKMKKLDGVKDDYDKKCDGRDKNLGTTD